MSEQPMYKRVLLKISGEALSGGTGFGINNDVVSEISLGIKKLNDVGVEVAVVVGGGNFWRGRQSEQVDRYKADQVGILATLMNCIYVSEIFRLSGMKTRIMSSFSISDMSEVFSKDEANKALQNGEVVFCACGTGHPYFSTDTGVVLRALELTCKEILLAKAIDGVYDKDPKKFPDAKKYDTLSIEEVVEKRLQVIDLSASILCLENRLPMSVFSLEEEDGIFKALLGEHKGTRVTAD